MKAIRDVYDTLNTITCRALTASVTGTAIDLANVIENEFVFLCGTWTDGTYAYKLTDSSDNVTYNDVTSTLQVGTLANTSGTATAVTQAVSYVGPNRYVKPVITVTAATTGMLMNAHAVVKYRKQP